MQFAAWVNGGGNSGSITAYSSLMKPANDASIDLFLLLTAIMGMSIL